MTVQEASRPREGPTFPSILASRPMTNVELPTRFSLDGSLDVSGSRGQMNTFSVSANAAASGGGGVGTYNAATANATANTATNAIVTTAALGYSGAGVPMLRDPSASTATTTSLLPRRPLHHLPFVLRSTDDVLFPVTTTDPHHTHSLKSLLPADAARRIQDAADVIHVLSETAHSHVLKPSLQDADAPHAIATVNGQTAESQVPNFYQPPPIVDTTAHMKRPVLSKDDVRVLLFHTARIGDVLSIRALCRCAHFNVNDVDDEGRTPLMFAAMGGHELCISILLDRGAVIHQSDYTGRTALHWAAWHGHAGACKLLLKHGATCMMEDYQGKTPLHCVANSDSPKTLRTLLKYAQRQQSYAVIDCRDEDQMTPLLWAVARGRLELTKALIKLKADICAQDAEGRSAMHWAITSKHQDCIPILLRFCPQLVNMKDRYMRTPMHIACGDGNISVAYMLLQHADADMNVLDETKRTPVHWAAVCGHVSILKFFCELGAKISTNDAHGATPLHYTAQQNFQDCAHVLIRNGADLNSVDVTGRTPLIWAVIQGHTDIMRLLLFAGADVNIAEENGMTGAFTLFCSLDFHVALHFAAFTGNASICQLLLSHGASIDARDAKLHTPLFRATIAGHIDTVVLLISEHADVNLRDSASRSVIHWAASSGDVDMMNVFAENGVDLDGRDQKGTRPLHEAAFHGKADAVSYLLSHNADPNARDTNGVTPLHWAAVTGNVPCCRLLIEAGAKVNATTMDVDRDTPLNYAYLNHHVECAQYLVDHGGMLAEEVNRAGCK